MTCVRKLKHCLRFMKSCNSQSRNKINIFFWRGGGEWEWVLGTDWGRNFFRKIISWGPVYLGPKSKVFQGEMKLYWKTYRIEIRSKRDGQTTLSFKILKMYHLQKLKQPRFYVFQKHQKRHVKAASIFYPSKLYGK